MGFRTGGGGYLEIKYFITIGVCTFSYLDNEYYGNKMMFTTSESYILNARRVQLCISDSAESGFLAKSHKS